MRGSRTAKAITGSRQPAHLRSDLRPLLVRAERQRAKAPREADIARSAADAAEAALEELELRADLIVCGDHESAAEVSLVEDAHADAPDPSPRLPIVKLGQRTRRWVARRTDECHHDLGILPAGQRLKDRGAVDLEQPRIGSTLNPKLRDDSGLAGQFA